VSLYDRAATLAGIAKHTPESLDPHEVRAVCNQMIDFLALFADCDQVDAARCGDGYTLTIVTDIDSLAALDVLTAALWA